MSFVLSSLLISLTACGRAVPSQTYSPYAIVPTKPQDRTEISNISAITLASTTPAGLASDPAKRIVLARSTKYGWVLSGGQWLQSNASRYAADGLILALDRGLEFGFALTPLELTGHDADGNPTRLHGLRLLIKNASTSSATIDWNAVTIVGNGGKAYPTTHRGIRYAEAAAPMTPATVPPSATLDDFIFPREDIQLTSGQWRGRLFFETMQPGDTFGLFLPVRRGQGTVEYFFAFAVSSAPDVTQHAVAWPLVPDPSRSSAVECAERSGWMWNDIQERCMLVEPAPPWCMGQWTGVRCIRR